MKRKKLLIYISCIVFVLAWLLYVWYTQDFYKYFIEAQKEDIDQLYFDNVIDKVDVNLISDWTTTWTEIGLTFLLDYNPSFGEYVAFNKKMEIFRDDLSIMRTSLQKPNADVSLALHSIYDKFSLWLDIIIEWVNVCIVGSKQLDRTITSNCWSAFGEWLKVMTKWMLERNEARDTYKID